MGEKTYNDIIKVLFSQCHSTDCAYCPYKETDNCEREFKRDMRNMLKDFERRDRMKEQK